MLFFAKPLVPDLISIMYGVGQTGRNPWLYSSMEINKEALYLIIQAWIKTAFSKASAESRQRVLNELLFEDLQWQAKTLDLAKWETHSNSTAKPDSDSFIILPDYLAAQLSKPDVTFEIGSTVLRFRRAPVGRGGRVSFLAAFCA